MKTRSLITLTGLCLASFMAMAQQAAPAQAPTLADIARQKRSEKAKKVFTSEDMKAAPEETIAPAAAEGEAAKAPVAKNDEAIAAVAAKVEDQRYREVTLNKSIGRFETSLAQANAEGNEERVKTYQDSIDAAKAQLATATQERMAAEKQLDDMKAAKAAADAAPKKKAKPATRPKS